MKIFLLTFDVDQLFHNGSRPLYIMKVFEYSDAVKNPYHKLHQDLFVHKKYNIYDLFENFFDDGENSVPGYILEKIKDNKHRHIHRKFSSYYRYNEKEFFQDVDKTWETREGINGYTFVSDVHKLLSLMEQCGDGAVENYDEEFDLNTGS